MSKDIIMFMIGMSMALLVSLLGMLLAYLSYKKRSKQTNSFEIKNGGEGNAND